MRTLAGILVVAAVATTGDYVWYTFGVRHNMTNGIVHGVVLLTTVGLVLGAQTGRVLRGLPIGVLAGLGGALLYYLLVAILDPRPYGLAIPGAWLAMWLLLAALEGRWLNDPPRSAQGIAARGLAAAALGSVAFYLVMQTLWGRPPATGRNYALQFLAWAFAWAPGLLALTVGPRPGPGPQGDSQHAGAISVADLSARIERGDPPPILDVRFAGEFTADHIPGAVNIPFHQVPSRLSELPGGAGDDLVVYCGHGPRAYMAGAALRNQGRRILYLTGHWAAWRAARPLGRS